MLETDLYSAIKSEDSDVDFNALGGGRYSLGALTELLTSDNITWIETLADFDYEIKHKPVRLHRNADGFSHPVCKQCFGKVTKTHGSMS